VDNTIIVNAFAVGDPLIAFNTGSSTSTALRVTGFTFKGGNIFQTSNSNPNGFISFAGSSQNLRVDHLHLNTTTYNNGSRLDVGGGMTLYGYIYGVVDHLRLDFTGQENGVRSYNQSGGASAGDLPWSQPTQLGTNQFLFIENSYFNGGFVNDCDAGGRQVARYNTVISDVNDTTGDSGAIQSHTTGQGVARERGCRVIERYHNYFINPTPSVGHQFSAGDGNVGGSVYFGNTITTGYNNDLVLEENSRVLQGNNCGAGFNVTGGCAAPPAGFGYCGNGSSSVLSVWDGDTNSQGYPCLDQTGRGQGDLLNGANFPGTRNNTTSCVPTSPPGCSVWPHQLREPYYIWNENSVGTVCNAIVISGTGRVANRDFYCQIANTANSGCPGACTPFTGATGTGFGPLAQRPTTCTAGPGGAFDTSPGGGSWGVAYFATDTNTLYICYATNTWGDSAHAGTTYTPYTYPHPLDTGP
jgi:hypothetical protein